MLIIGLTGGIGSGKTAVSDLFESLGVDVVDADVVARKVVLPGSQGLQAIIEHFGPVILEADATLNRRQLRNIIFSDPAEKKWLENILHPLIESEIKKKLQQSTSIYSILVSPLLLETKQSQLVDRVLVIDVPENLQLERVQARDQQSFEQVRAIMKSQLSRVDRLAKADDVIINDADFATLKENVEALHQFYLTLVQKNEKNN